MLISDGQLAYLLFNVMINVMICCVLLQIIMSTNIAESSITVPDVKYGKLKGSEF